MLTITIKGGARRAGNRGRSHDKEYPPADCPSELHSSLFLLILSEQLAEDGL